MTTEQNIGKIAKRVVLLSAGCMLWAGAALAMPFGGDEDVKFAEELWKVLEKDKLVGAGRINVRPFEGSEPHGTIQQATATTATMRGRTARVLVKTNHGGKGASIESVYDNPNKFVGAFTVMFKREKGYDAENLDWFWAKYTKDGKIALNPKKMKLAGRVAKGNTEKGCIACHRAAGGEDLETLSEK